MAKLEIWRAIQNSQKNVADAMLFENSLHGRITDTAFKMKQNALEFIE